MSGDCHRTCIAMILDLPRDEVPHFMEHVPPDDNMGEAAADAEDAERAWLAERGLTPVHVAYPGELSLDAVVGMLATLARDAAVILGCQSLSGCDHSVVVYKGVIYNPGQRGGIVGPMHDGFWWVTVLAKATAPLPPTAEPASVVATQENN